LVQGTLDMLILKTFGHDEFVPQFVVGFESGELVAFSETAMPCQVAF
jgi:hypothetical protein